MTDEFGLSYPAALELLETTYPDARLTAKPDEKLLARLKETAAAALSIYDASCSDVPLVGAVTYDEGANTGTEFQDVLGMCTIHDTKPRLATIAIASSVLLHPSENYRLLIFLHELCHLSGVKHDEGFNFRFCHNLFRLFNPAANMDSREIKTAEKRF